MGDIAEAMLEGALCQGCGEFIGDGDGIPTLCGYCQGDADFEITPTTPEKVRCPHCQKKVKAVGLQMHIKAVHNI